ncbi:cysteine protease StiP family protein [Sporosarcina sp. A2]|uniref:cysteine protease StiP family protein n=1 Tax=Sporosarcina sp. A2 TaxID=3393449 RepID=UPI003D7A68BD
MVDQNVQTLKGSYATDDVIFLLKDLSQATLEKSLDEREQAIQSGVHYSEMLPIEYEPTRDYLELFHESLHTYKEKVASATGTVSELILERKGTDIVLVSLARAGTPIGILMKRYMKEMHNISVPHYSISIIRGRGVDENALNYLIRTYPTKQLVFVDGWTGKGAIAKELTKSVAHFNEKYGTQLSDDLAVLADPGYCSSLYGTREDFLIPSACLNSTVSGLVSRTVLNDEWIGVNDFHGAKVYAGLEEKDVSNYYIDVITREFENAVPEIQEMTRELQHNQQEPTWKGLQDIVSIQDHYGIEDINLIKPGVGETTRVLLRRIPWKILVRNDQDPSLKHILQLAKERNVEVEVYDHMAYSCCGLIKPLDTDL